MPSHLTWLIHPHHFMLVSFVFFFNDTATTEIYTLSLHDALPICRRRWSAGYGRTPAPDARRNAARSAAPSPEDRKSTRLNSSHRCISYAVFCLKKKKDSQVQDHGIPIQRLECFRSRSPRSKQIGE